jgi:hypothetical protein
VNPGKYAPILVPPHPLYIDFGYNFLFNAILKLSIITVKKDLSHYL